MTILVDPPLILIKWSVETIAFFEKSAMDFLGVMFFMVHFLIKRSVMIPFVLIIIFNNLTMSIPCQKTWERYRILN